MKTTNEIMYNLRIDADMTQSQIGTILGITQRRISFIETNTTEPNLDDIRAYCKFFNISADYILGMIETQKPLFDRLHKK